MFVSSCYTTGVVNKAGLAHSSGAPEITPGFLWNSRCLFFLVLCVTDLSFMCPLIFDFLFNGLVAFVSQPNRLINLHYWEIVSIYFHSQNWMQSMTRRRVKTGHLPNSRDLSGDWKISGERTHFGKFMTDVTSKKNRVSWHAWTTFSYIGYQRRI